MERRIGPAAMLFAMLALVAGGPLSATVDVSPGADAPVPLYDDLGDHHHPITARTPETQRYFDQGLRLVYAFNHAEAIRAFTEAARLDPQCAMCYWGIALAHGPNINAPMEDAAVAEAYQAVQQALALSPGVSARERAYIEALAQRYSADPSADREALDQAYARAMRTLVQHYPDDLDAATLYAEALMDLSPWEYWTADGQPKPATEQILAALERVIERNPRHPGACHYYIHAVEAVHPERAVPCADRLASLMPGAGHLVHMPAHIYVRVGRYADAIEANRHAVHADERYIADQRPEGIYPLGYYPHNYHFLSFAATLAGRAEEAVEAARALAERVPVEVAAAVPELQTLLAHPYLTLATFGRWEELLGESLPAQALPFARALAHYARGVAAAATDRLEQAEAEARQLQQVQVETELQGQVLEIARHALAGEIAARSGRLEEAAHELRAAVQREDALPYMEPPHWHHPVRHALGAVLLEAGRAQEAEQVYREDLARFPENGWALYGLAASLRAQGREPAAQAAEERFRRAWREADVQLSASRF
jgi:tetratricopeptide (TPR) repeat protein